VRVGVPSQDRHGFALAFAEMTGTNLRRARAIVRDRPLIVDAAPPGLALAAAVQIERTGGLVEFELGRIERFAAIEGHPLRGLAPCERLTIRGGALTLTRGALAEVGEVVTLIARGTPSQLFAGFEGERARWAAAGLLDVGSEAELLRRLGAHEPRLEARLRAAPREAYFDRAEIYGDWLQAHGDPRGLVASASLALARVSDPRARDSAIATLTQIVGAHASHLLGSLVHELEPAALAWLGPGLVRAKLTPATVRRDQGQGAPPRIVAARVPGTTAEDTAQLEQLAYLGPLALLDRLLALPVSATLRELELADEFVNHAQVPASLAAAACASGLERLDLAGAVDLRLTGAGFAKLRRLTLTRVRGELVCALQAPALRRLSVEFDEGWPDLDASLADLDAPRLRQLDLRLRSRTGAHAGSLAPALEALLTRPSFARLRSLILTGPPAAFEGLEQALARTPAAQTLERVEFPRGG
jgi:hypothetical protein